MYISQKGPNGGDEISLAEIEDTFHGTMKQRGKRGATNKRKPSNNKRVRNPTGQQEMRDVRKAWFRHSVSCAMGGARGAKRSGQFSGTSQGHGRGRGRSKRTPSILTPGHSLEFQGKLKILTLNVNGIGEPGKLLDSPAFVGRESPVALVVAESQLTKQGARGLKVPGYLVLTESSCPKDDEKIRGGVVILVKDKISGGELTGHTPQLRHPQYSWSALIYLKAQDTKALKITGVYLPPKGDQTAQLLSLITAPKADRVYEGKRIGHLLVEGFNHPSWDAGYRTWTNTCGLWELSDPTKRTYSSGNALDKFLFAPGENAPLALLQNGLAFDMRETGGSGDSQFYSAFTFPAECVGNHHPVMLEIPYGDGLPKPAIRLLKIKTLTEEQREEQDQDISTKLNHQGKVQRLLDLNNAARLWDFLSSPLERVFAKHYTRRGGTKRKKQTDVWKQFFRHHASHDQTNRLKFAYNRGNRQEMRRLARIIKAAGWRRYLNGVRAANLTAIYKYIEKTDGRKPKVFTYPCARPLTNQGRVFAGGGEKCSLLGEYFANRMTNPLLLTQDSKKRALPEGQYIPHQIFIPDEVYATLFSCRVEKDFPFSKITL